MIPYPIHSTLDAHTYDSFIRYRPRQRRMYKGKVVQLGINRQKALRALRNSVKYPYGRPIAGRKATPKRNVNQRNIAVQQGQKKPAVYRPIPFGNPIHRDLEGYGGISKIGRYNRKYKGIPILPGDPGHRHKVQQPKSRPVKKGSKDIVLPYKRKYGSGKSKPLEKSIQKKNIPSKETIPQQQTTVAPQTSEITTMNQSAEEKPTKDKQKRAIRNIIGIAALSLITVGVVIYALKTKAAANGRTR